MNFIKNIFLGIKQGYTWLRFGLVLTKKKGSVPMKTLVLFALLSTVSACATQPMPGEEDMTPPQGINRAETQKAPVVYAECFTDQPQMCNSDGSCCNGATCREGYCWAIIGEHCNVGQIPGPFVACFEGTCGARQVCE